MAEATTTEQEQADLQRFLDAAKGVQQSAQAMAKQFEVMAVELAAIHQLLRREFDARRAANGPISFPS